MPISAFIRCVLPKNAPTPMKSWNVKRSPVLRPSITARLTQVGGSGAGQKKPEERIRRERAEDFPIPVAVPVRRTRAEIECESLLRMEQVALVIEREAPPCFHVAAPKNGQP